MAPVAATKLGLHCTLARLRSLGIFRHSGRLGGFAKNPDKSPRLPGEDSLGLSIDDAWPVRTDTALGISFGATAC